MQRLRLVCHRWLTGFAFPNKRPSPFSLFQKTKHSWVAAAISLPSAVCMALVIPQMAAAATINLYVATTGSDSEFRDFNLAVSHNAKGR